MQASVLLHLDNQLGANSILGLQVKVLRINEGVEQEVLAEVDRIAVPVKELELDQVDVLLDKDPLTIPLRHF